MWCFVTFFEFCSLNSTHSKCLWQRKTGEIINLHKETYLQFFFWTSIFSLFPNRTKHTFLWQHISTKNNVQEKQWTWNQHRISTRPELLPGVNGHNVTGQKYTSIRCAFVFGFSGYRCKTQRWMASIRFRKTSSDPLLLLSPLRQEALLPPAEGTDQQMMSMFKSLQTYSILHKRCDLRNTFKNITVQNF